MKKLIVAMVGSIAVMAGSAYAGCFDGHASAEPEKSVVASAEESDPGILAKLKKQDEVERLEKLIERPPAYN